MSLLSLSLSSSILLSLEIKSLDLDLDRLLSLHNFIPPSLSLSPVKYHSYPVIASCFFLSCRFERLAFRFSDRIFFVLVPYLSHPTSPPTWAFHDTPLPRYFLSFSR
ncbi:hypothetical protein F4775DRAFT_184787 [Biscogniauxia sp. FL1348]|nr:hypothetical protein F4775DRAFT_184787 [Biscogniauxia sp. FL1348]